MTTIDPGSSGVGDGTTTGVDPDEHSRRLAAQSLAADDATGWFERLYQQAAHGDAVIPWDRGMPNALLIGWTSSRHLEGTGQRAVVVGCGLGRDAEHVAALRFQTVAFDISPTAVRLARQRYPSSAVQYEVANLSTFRATGTAPSA